MAHAKNPSHTRQRLAAPNLTQLDAVSIITQSQSSVAGSCRSAGFRKGAQHGGLLSSHFWRGAERDTAQIHAGGSDSSLSSRETCLRGAEERQTETELINSQIRHSLRRCQGVLQVPLKGRGRGGRDKDGEVKEAQTETGGKRAAREGPSQERERSKPMLIRSHIS